MPEITIPDVDLYRRRTRTYDTPSDNTAELIAAIRLILPPTGTIAPTLSTVDAGDGWKVCDGRALIKAEFPTLYGILGATYGETATTFNLPDLRGRAILGAGGDPGFALLAYAGAAAVTLTVDQMPSHSHAVTDPGHTHTFTGTPHDHAVTDPGHVHTVTDPGHTHAAAAATTTGTAGTDAGGAAGNTGSATTGITVDSATTGLTVDEETAGGTNSTETTGITIADTGGDQPFDIIPPVVAVNWIIRT